MIGAIFCETRPAMIIRSDCRGDPRNTSAPKRAISKREADMDIISMAQQASPNDMGQMEFLRAQLIALPSDVVTMPSESKPSSKPASSIRANSSGGPLARGVSSMILSSHDRGGKVGQATSPPHLGSRRFFIDSEIPATSESHEGAYGRATQSAVESCYPLALI